MGCRLASRSINCEHMLKCTQQYTMQTLDLQPDKNCDHVHRQPVEVLCRARQDTRLEHGPRECASCTGETQYWTGVVAGNELHGGPRNRAAATTREHATCSTQCRGESGGAYDHLIEIDSYIGFVV